MLAGPGLKLGHEQGGRDVAEFEGAGDAQELVPVLGDEIDLGVVVEERACPGPAGVATRRMGAPELPLGEFGDPGSRCVARMQASFSSHPLVTPAIVAAPDGIRCATSSVRRLGGVVFDAAPGPAFDSKMELRRFTPGRGNRDT